jgi:hypothetical protein
MTRNEAVERNNSAASAASPLQLIVYAQHGRELMGCKSPVGEPTSKCSKVIGAE